MRPRHTGMEGTLAFESAIFCCNSIYTQAWREFGLLNQRFLVVTACMLALDS